MTGCSRPCFRAATLLLAALGGIIVSLAIGGWPAFREVRPRLLHHRDLEPGDRGLWRAGAIVGTLVTSALALVFALPLALGVAVFLVELCPAVLRRPIGTAVELLAGIPSIVYGMWGLFVFAPWFAKHIQMPAMMAAPRRLDLGDADRRACPTARAS